MSQTREGGPAEGRPASTQPAADASLPAPGDIQAEVAQRLADALAARKARRERLAEFNRDKAARRAHGLRARHAGKSRR